MKDPQQRDGLERTQAKIKSFNKKELKATIVTEHDSYSAVYLKF